MAGSGSKLSTGRLRRATAAKPGNHARRPARQARNRSIAWAIAEYLHQYPGAKAKTLFATHYHEITALAQSRSAVKNYNVAVKEWNQQIIFLRKILPEELEYDFLFSQRGVMNLAHTLGDVRESMRRVNANKLNGIDAEWISPEQVKELCPIINIGDDIRYPVMGATYQPRAGIAKHDHVAWAFARKCDEMGVDIIQNCEVTGFVKDGNRVVGVETSRVSK